MSRLAYKLHYTQRRGKRMNDKEKQALIQEGRNQALYLLLAIGQAARVKGGKRCAQ